jgi:F-type H+-transporting ATPase subunit b
MEQIFVALQGIIVRALPTFLLVIALHWYLKKVLIQPMERVLDERRRRTEGTIEAADSALAEAARRLAAYERALAEARTAIYRDQDVHRKALAVRLAKTLEQERTKMSERVAAAKAQVDAEAARSRNALAAQADALADRIATAVLAGAAR